MWEKEEEKLEGVQTQPNISTLLDLQYFDYLYQGGATFDDMIHKAFKAKKSFVVAIVKTRSNNTFEQNVDSSETSIKIVESSQKKNENRISQLIKFGKKTVNESFTSKKNDSKYFENDSES